MNPKAVLLVGGPGDGKVLPVTDVNDVIYYPVIESINLASLGDLYPTKSVSMRKATYRARRIASTGHPVHNIQTQQVLFDYEGTS